MFRVLRGEMVKADLTVVRLSEELGISEKSLRNKLNGITEFSWKYILTNNKRGNCESARAGRVKKGKEMAEIRARP